jgi:hypothetical protein
VSRGMRVVVGCVLVAVIAAGIAAAWAAQSRDASAAGRCISAWNNPTDQTVDAYYAPPTAFSSGRRLGFVSRRAAVTQGSICLMWFDVGHGWAYSFAATQNNESPVITGWSGNGSLVPADVVNLVWNACQRDDGTLAAGLGSCPPHDPRVKPRPLVAELEYRLVQGVLGNTQDLGFSPFWLGTRFRGALLQPTASDDRQEIDYRVWYHGRSFMVFVYTYHPQLDTTPSCLSDASACAAGASGPKVLFRRDTAGLTLVVAYYQSMAEGEARAPFPPAVLRQIRRALHRPTQLQLLEVRPPETGTGSSLRVGHGVDPLQPRRPLGFGHTWLGLQATVLRNTPPGVGVVRYGHRSAPGRLYVVTYRPADVRCGQSGCPMSPQPPPGQARRYGSPMETWELADAWVTVILAPHPQLVTLPYRSNQTPRPL